MPRPLAVDLEKFSCKGGLLARTGRKCSKIGAFPFSYIAVMVARMRRTARETGPVRKLMSLIQRRLFKGASEAILTFLSVSRVPFSVAAALVKATSGSKLH